MDSRVSAEILRRVREIREKRADAPLSAAIEAARQIQSNTLRSDALKDIASAGMVGLGVGAGARGLSGLLGLLSRNTKHDRLMARPAVVSIPIPQPPGDKTKSAGLRDFLAGNYALGKGAIPWYLPAVAAAPVAGVAAGWEGVGKLLNAPREAEEDAELESARREFQDALVGQHQPAGARLEHRKQAAADSLGANLDRIFDGLQKRGVDLGNLVGRLAKLTTEPAGYAAGMYGLYAVPAAVGTGLMAYSQTAKRQRDALLEKAMQKRQRRRFMQSPPEIYARTTPVSVPNQE